MNTKCGLQMDKNPIDSYEMVRGSDNDIGGKWETFIA